MSAGLWWSTPEGRVRIRRDAVARELRHYTGVVERCTQPTRFDRDLGITEADNERDAVHARAEVARLRAILSALDAGVTGELASLGLTPAARSRARGPLCRGEGEGP